MSVIDERLTVLATPEEVGAVVAGDVLAAMDDAIAERGRFVLGCPGGRTPMSTFQALAAEFRRRDTDLSSMIIVMMDDYVVPDGSGWAHVDARAHYSCRRFAVDEIQALFNAAVSPAHAIPDANVWFPDASDPDAYEGRLAEIGGIDYFILASGAGDGHVAFNPPGTAESARTRIVELAEQTRVDNLGTFPDFASIDEVPHHGVTVGPATITGLSRKAVMIALGEAKAGAVARLVDGEGYDPSWPATIFRVIPGARIYADSAAAASLDV